MGRTVAAIILIFFLTTFAWFILAASITSRTNDSGSELVPKVSATWGAPQTQFPPSASVVQRMVEQTVTDPATSSKKTIAVPELRALPIERSRINVALDLDQRQKGLLWFATYRVDFRGDYIVRNDSDQDDVTVKLAFPVPNAIYDNLVLRIDGQPVPLTTVDGGVSTTIHRAPGAPFRVEVGYRSQGLSTWCYSFGSGVAQVRDFQLDMRTSFRDIDFPQGTLSPTQKVQQGSGWQLAWHYTNVVTGYGIGMVMPEKLQPGPLAGRISMFAPVSLLFFFFVMFLIATLRKIHLHPMHYFFLATSFFAFHLLLAYLVDHISIHYAFAICSAVSIFLVVSYLRVVVSPQFALREAAIAQFVYLVLFSYAFFFKGFTGLAITIGAIASLFIAMQATARVNWRTQAAQV